MSAASSSVRRLAWAAATAVAVRGLTGSINTVASLRWLRDHHARDASSQDVSPRPGPAWPHFVLIVPLLREQRVLPATVEHLAAMVAEWGDASLVLVTTEREHRDWQRAKARLSDLAEALHTERNVARVVERFAGVLPTDRLTELARWAAGRSRAECVQAVEETFTTVPSTPLLAADLVDKARRDGVDAQHYHHHDPSAQMVQQINHAAREEITRLTAASVGLARIWIAVYNADSRPEPASLSGAANVIGSTGGTRVMQQSALFTANIGALDNGAVGAFLTGAALLQSRWTLAREIPRLRRQSRWVRATSAPAGWWPRLAHCVGHGLFVRADAFTEIGGLPEAPMNEDLAFGYLLCAAGVAIDPLPVVEWADTPETPGAAIRQARQWFWSYTEYVRFARLAAAAGAGTPLSRTILSAQGLARGAIWLGQSPAIAIACLLPFLDRRPRAALATAGALSAYYVIPFVLLARHPRVQAALGHRLGARELAGGLVAALTASAGPWWCLANAVRRGLRGVRYDHDKTER